MDAGQSLDPRTVGLFGTCGGSAWREPFMREFERLGIPFVNLPRPGKAEVGASGYRVAVGSLSRT